jgi:hypothetical protein
MANDKNKNARAQCDRYLISATAGGWDFHAFWAPSVLATKLKTGREVEKLLFKNCPKIETALKADPSNGGSAVWAAEAADPDSIALMDLH